MTLVAVTKFSGIAPKLSPYSLPQSNAQVAQNVRLTARTLKPWNTPLTVQSDLPANDPSTIYRFDQDLISDTQYWFHWTADVDVVKSAVANDGAERTYITHPTLGPIVTNASLALVDLDATYSLVSNVVTVTCSSAHYLTVGDEIYVDATSGALVDGAATIATVTSATVFTFARTAANTSGSCNVKQSQTYPYRWYKLGVPVPVSAPTAVPSGGTGVAESRVYVFTYLTAYGEEGPPSPTSTAVDVLPGATVNLSGLGTAPPSGYGAITGKRIYRTVSGNAATAFQFVDEIPITQATYADAAPSAQLGEVIPSVTWDAPPSTGFSICQMANGITLIAKGYDIYASEAYRPHAYPTDYVQTVDFPIVGVKSFGSSAVICTTGHPYLLSGSDPSSLTLTKLEKPQACSSKRSMISVGDGIVYASPDGLVAISGNGQVDVVTGALFGREEWQTLVPASIDGYMHDGMYVGFYNTGGTTGGFIFDPEQGDAALVMLDSSMYSTAGYSDLVQDALFVKQGTNIVKWNAGAGKMTYTWKSSYNQLPYPQNLGYGMVVASAYPVTLKVFADGILKHTQTVANRNIFPLPSGFRASYYEFEVSGTNEVSGVYLASSAQELREV